MSESLIQENEEFIGDTALEGIARSSSFVCNGRVIGKPFNLQQLVDKYSKDAIPDTLGIYHLFYHDQLVYIGMSKSIRKRLMQHLGDNDMPFNNVLWFCSDQLKENATIADVLEVEYRMIKYFKPVLNGTGANCR
jgi:predicted GIY-YIG superfamily endonuclease